MKHQIFVEIDRFDRWAQKKWGIPQDEICEKVNGEWELLYDGTGEGWDSIYASFSDFIKNTDCRKWTDSEIERILYIIARDNEDRRIVGMLEEHEDAMILLAERSLSNASPYAKWQLAVASATLSDSKTALDLLKRFVEDPDEYVVRRSLMALAEIGYENTESLCNDLWFKNRYGDREEYQRMAILESLRIIRSDKLNEYIKLAKQDGRRYLKEFAEKLEAGCFLEESGRK